MIQLGLGVHEDSRRRLHARVQPLAFRKDVHVGCCGKVRLGAKPVVGERDQALHVSVRLGAAGVGVVRHERAPSQHATSTAR